MNIIKAIEKDFKLNDNKLNFRSGYIIRVNFKVLNEKTRKKNYNFEGVVISIKKNGINTTCTIRKISYGEGVEKTFFLNSPAINSINIIKKIGIRKSKYYYIR